MILREYIQGVPVDLHSKMEVLALVTNWLRIPERPRHIVTLNALMLLTATQNCQLNRVIREADLITMDGRGVIEALRKKGCQTLKQFTGIELAKELLDWCALQNCPVSFYGGSPAAAVRLRVNLSRRWPGLVICGINDGFGGPRKQMEIMEELQRNQPSLLLVGLGSPAQEFFLAKALPHLNNTVGIGVGGTLDVLAGLRQEAPQFIRDQGLEWLYRMFQDPVKFKRLPDLFRFWYRCLR